jgi:hypothetical protein
MWSNRWGFADCRPGRKSALAATPRRRRRPGLAPAPRRCGRSWRAASRHSRLAGPCRKKGNTAVAPFREFDGSILPVLLVDDQIMPVGSTPSDLVHVLEILLVVAQIATNVAIPWLCTAARDDLVWIKNQYIGFDRQSSGGVDHHVKSQIAEIR